MSTHIDPSPTHALDEQHTHNRVLDETKPSFKTTELIVYVLAVVGVLIASAMTDSGADSSAFGAKSAWLYVTLLTVGYMISRGLAKSGSRSNHNA